MNLRLCILVLSLRFSCQTIDINAPEQMNSFVMEYLKKYHYLQNDEHQDPRLVIAALKRCQKNANVDVTGTITQETVNMMKRPRCGAPDEPPRGNNTKRHKRYAIFDPDFHWCRRHLSWKVRKYSDSGRLTPSQIDRIMATAFSYWARHTSLTFTEVSCNPEVLVDSNILFERGEENDFDGPGGTLAYAYFPYCFKETTYYVHGNIYFDDDEKWSYGYEDGAFSMLKVMVHEIGHALGLAHTTDKTAIMYAYYSGHGPMDPQADDIAGIQALYGCKSDVYSVPGVPDLLPLCPAAESCRNRCCQNGGTKMYYHGQCYCECPWHYIGTYCHICRPFLCFNGGRQMEKRCRCKCPWGYFGRFCQWRSCTLKCKNGGKLLKSCQCKCRVGYKGYDCGIYDCKDEYICRYISSCSFWKSNCPRRCGLC